MCLCFRYASELDKRVQKLGTNGGCEKRVKSLVSRKSLWLQSPDDLPGRTSSSVALPANEVNVQSQATDCTVALSPTQRFTCLAEVVHVKFTPWEKRRDGQRRSFSILYLQTDLYLFSSVINILTHVWVNHTASSWLEDSGDGRIYIFLWILSGFWEFLFKRCLNSS